jgi:ribosomal protein S18 acetylase RimI-like enzyme
MELRSVGYRTDLMIRVLEGSEVADRGDYLVIRTAANPTYWWGNFLLLAEPPNPASSDEWLAAFAREFPAARHVTLGIDVTDAAEVDGSGLASAGLRPEVSAVLEASAVHAPPRPNATASYRPLAGDDDWRQAADLRAAITAGSPGADPAFLAARVATERALTEGGNGSWYGAFTEGRLAATLGLITDGGGLARYQNVETHPEARGRGLAGTLVWQAGQQFLAAGRAERLVIVADPDYIAIRVYESVGFARTQAQVGFERQPEEAAGA